MAEIWWPLDRVQVTGEWANSPAFYAQFGQRGHNGIDLAANVGTPVYATDDGVVHAEGWGQHNNWMGSIAGIYVLLKHWWGYSGYAHLSRTIVNRGQKISRGQKIGESGATGVGTGPHLHFETFPLHPNFGNGFAGRVNPRTHTIRARGHKAPAKGKTMSTLYHREDADARSRGRTMPPGAGFWLHTAKNQKISQASNLVGGVGNYALVAHIYGTGTPGDKVRIKYVWDLNGKKSAHYAHDFEVGVDGKLHGNAPFARAVASGIRVFLRIETPSSNKGTVKLSVADSDALLIA